MSKPKIIVKLFGEEYTGPFSNFSEWHSAEYGILFGMWAAFMLINPQMATALLAAIGAKSIKDAATEGLRKQIANERHYFAGAGAVMFMVVVTTALVFGVEVSLDTAMEVVERLKPLF